MDGPWLHGDDHGMKHTAGGRYMPNRQGRGGLKMKAIVGLDARDGSASAQISKPGVAVSSS